MKSELLAKIKKNSTLDHADVLGSSKFFNKKDMIQTSIPALNIIMSGSLDGGFTPGSTMFAGPSKHFKTLFALILLKSYLEKYEEGVAILYDSEFGSPLAYFDGLGIDPERVLHCPFEDVEQLKFDFVKQLNGIEKGEKVFFCIDSIGMAASRKEVEDALNEKSVADMTRAKALKSLFRIVVPKLVMKDVPLVSVNHTYKEIGMFPKDIVGGGTGSYYGSDNIYIIGRQQEKDGAELTGYNFIINVEKSRYVKEKSKIGIEVAFEGGVNKWSGLLDIALEGGFVVKPKNGWYQVPSVDAKSYREAETNTPSFWLPLLKDKAFQTFIETKYKLGTGPLIGGENVNDKTD